MRRTFVAVLALALASMSQAPRAEDAFSRTDAMVAMSDGVRLEASVYVPAGAVPAGGYPLLVRQHGGGSNKDSVYDVRYGLTAVATGRFALLTYSHRGHGNSEGLFDFFGERTTRDASEMIDWVASAFPQVDTERVGMWGYSQGGGESLLPAEADARIKAVAVGNTFGNLDHALNPNDCFKLSFATGIFAFAYKSAAARTDDATALRWGAQWYSDTEDVALPVADPATGSVAMRSTTEDVSARSPSRHVEPVPGTVYDTGLNVPVFWSNSWEDALFPADHGLDVLAGLQARGIPTHQWFASGGHEAGDNFPADEAGKEAAMLEWFEEFLLGVDHGYASGARPRVDYAQRIPGSAAWTHKTAAQWPIPGVRTLHATAAGGLTETGFDPQISLGTIVNTAASANVATEPIVSNRAGPQPVLGDAQRAVPDSRNPLDTLTFAGEPLATGLEATGAPAVSIRYQSTASRVAQFDVKIWDDHDGARSLVWRGCVSDETPADGAADFDLWPNSHVFAAGHRVVATISTVDEPTFKADTEPQASAVIAATLTLRGVGA